MSDLVGNPEDRFSHNEAHFIELHGTFKPAVFKKGFKLQYDMNSIILLVQFGLLNGHLLGNSCPLGLQFVLVVFCLFVLFIYFPFWF